MVRVTVYSFSYKRGKPIDTNGNNGGFVFDCRPMPNPYWDKSLRIFSRRDAPVIDFFKNCQSEVDTFLTATETLIKQSIKAYANDSRTNLYVAFGCTGGQHRSVFPDEQMAARLREEDAVEVELIHTNQQNWKQEDENGRETNEKTNMTQNVVEHAVARLEAAQTATQESVAAIHNAYALRTSIDIGNASNTV